MLLVACTQSKRSSGAPPCRVGDFGEAPTVGAVGEAWRKHLATVSDRRKLLGLYKGGYWAAVRTAVASGLFEQTLVVSAGLGLRSVEATAPEYAATFRAGESDSVPGASSIDGRRAWWGLLGGSEALRSLTPDEDRPLIVALPENYLRVVLPDLETLHRRRPGSVVVFSTAGGLAMQQEAPDQWIRLDARMVRGLRCNTAALVVAATHRAMELCEADGWQPSRVRQALDLLVAADPRPLYPVRKKQTEQDVRSWLRVVLSGAKPPGSASAALRSFRDSGLGYEQKAFHRLFSDELARRGRAA